LFCTEDEKGTIVQSHIHTDAVQIFWMAMGVLIVFHAMRLVSAQMVDSDKPFVSTIGKGVAGLVTFSA
jgi:hypothetical protein